MSQLVAVYDACVLYPASLRDLLLHLAIAGLVRAKWTDEIHNEWIGALMKNRPDLTPEALQRTRALMDGAVLDCLVTGYQPLIEDLELPHRADRHVLAAAVHCQADVIVTSNLKHFPGETLKPHGIRALHPDAFVQRLIEIDLSTVCKAVRRQRALLCSPPKSAEELLDTFAKQGLHQTAARLRGMAELL